MQAAEFNFEFDNDSIGDEGIIGKLPWLNNLGVILIPDIEVDDDTIDLVETFLNGDMGHHYVAAVIVGQDYDEGVMERLLDLRKLSLVFAALELKESKDRQELILERLLLDP